ncbi:MAG: putative toxin-antitoxin system toxin component, PIN family [Sphingomonadales bacterium]|nr:putative toxin-antitoxin system toxin component, PIN family [Sphingomonadales bacterium]
MRVVLDTNVLFSGLASSETGPGQLLKHWHARRFQVMTCEEQIDEIRRVSRYAKMRGKFLPSEVGQLVSRLRKQTIVISTLPPIDRSPDPWDNYLLALSEVCHADFLVTGDKGGLLALGRHEGTAIVTVRHMLGRL